MKTLSLKDCRELLCNHFKDVRITEIHISPDTICREASAVTIAQLATQPSATVPSSPG